MNTLKGGQDYMYKHEIRVKISSPAADKLRFIYVYIFKQFMYGIHINTPQGCKHPNCPPLKYRRYYTLCCCRKIYFNFLGLRYSEFVVDQDFVEVVACNVGLKYK